jgi:hypothetical protein
MKLIRKPDLTYILILSSLLRVGLQGDLFPRDTEDVHHVEKCFQQQCFRHYGGVFTRLSVLEIQWDKTYALLNKVLSKIVTDQ